jgi:luciferase family oxidoreductase group 1
MALLSVLDLSPVTGENTQAAAVRESIEVAKAAERLGYHRFWVAEHHNIGGLGSPAPEVLIAALTQATRRIRLGSGGVMLVNYSPLKVAEVFMELEALAPGRIDLGVGRAPGADMRTALALNPNAHAAADGFPAQVRDLQLWLAGQPHQGITAHPRGPNAPEVWILGSSDYGAQLAAHFGLPYAFAYFFTDGQGCEQALALYRSLYRPSERHPTPQATICVWALAADSDDAAQHHALPRERWRLDRQRGVFGPLRAPAEIAAQGYTPAEQAQVDALRGKAFVGTPQRVAGQLRELAAELQLDELVVNTWTHDADVRRHSYRLLAQAFDLTPRP